MAALSAAKASADASATLAGKLAETGAVNTLNHARAQVFVTELGAQVTAARQEAAAKTRQLAPQRRKGARQNPAETALWLSVELMRHGLRLTKKRASASFIGAAVEQSRLV